MLKRKNERVCMCLPTVATSQAPFQRRRYKANVIFYYALGRVIYAICRQVKKMVITGKRAFVLKWATLLFNFQPRLDPGRKKGFLQVAHSYFQTVENENYFSRCSHIHTSSYLDQIGVRVLKASE